MYFSCKMPKYNISIYMKIENGLTVHTIWVDIFEENFFVNTSTKVNFLNVMDLILLHVRCKIARTHAHALHKKNFFLHAW